MALIAAGLLLRADLSISSARRRVNVQAAGESAVAAANGFRRLQPWEFAAFDSAPATGTARAADAEAAQVAVRTADGQTYTVAQTPGGTTAVVGGAPGVTTFVREGDGVTVQGSPAGDTSSKIDERLKKLKGNDDSETPVIIRFNLPFRQFYDGSNGNASVRAQKRREFDDAKSHLNGILNGRGHLKSDLLVVNGVAAAIKPSVLDALEADGTIAKVEPDVVDHVTLDTSVDEIGARSVWAFSDGYNNSMTGVGRRIAIIDTGVDYTHPDLGGCLGPGCKVVGGWNFLTNTPDPMDDYGHGTHVAAIAAGNGLLRGVAPDANIIAYKVCNSSGACYSSDIIAALGYAADPNHDGDQSDHVDVASMSLGGGGNPDDSQSLAADNATSAGVVVTVAAGNAGPGAGTIQSPGTARTAITVAAACKSAQVGTNSYCGTPVASFSSRGPLVWGGQDLQKPDVSAPGVLICAARWANAFAGSPTCFDNQHIRISGTSMATPHVAGAAALIRQAFPTYTPDQVKQLLKNTARDLGQPYDEQGAGEINVLAAIPGSSKLVATPNSLDVSTDPSVKTTRLDNDFMVTPVDHSISALDVSANLNVPGVTLAFGKTTLNVAGGATDGFHVTTYVDNDVARAGTYQGSIVLSEGGQSKGIIPVTLHIAPTIQIGPSPIDFGTDNPSLANWTSAQSVTVTNFRADTSQTVTLMPPTFPAGVTFSAPSAISVAPGSAYTFTATVAANNNTVANGSYAGQLSVSNATTSAVATARFIKFYTLTISDASGGIVGSFALVHNRVNTQSTFTVGASQTTLYEDAAGPYDLIIYYPRTTDAAADHDYAVFKEGIDLSSGSATVNASRADASLQTKMIATDPSGAALAQIGQRASSDRYLNTGLGVLRLNSGTDTTTNYFSPVSAGYTHHEEYETMRQSSPVLDFYYGGFTGLSADRAFTNSAADFKTLQIKTDPNGASGQALPVVFTCLPGGNNCFALYYNTSTLTMPVAQTIHSLLPAGAYQYQSSDVLRTGCPASGPCASQYSTPFMDVASQVRKTNPGDAASYPTWQNGTIYNGLGPSLWAAKFANTSGTVRVVPYYSTYAPVLFLRQDYSFQEYANTLYTLAGPTAASGTLYGTNAGTWSLLPSLNVQAGAYQFDVAGFTYYNRGVSLNAKVRANFNTTLADPNPPSLTQLTYTTDGAPSDAHDSAANNQLYFAFDPVGGTLSQATAAFSGDGASFTPLPVAPGGAGFVANVPAVPFTKLTLRVTGTDNSGNSLQYTFELPAINPISDAQPPTTSITSPANNQTVNGVVPVQVSAQDDFGVTQVELYRDGTLVGAKTAAPYTFNWDTTTVANGSHTLTAKAYDAGANAATSAAVSVNVQNDFVAPAASITSPSNGQTVSATVTVQASASDNVGVTRVELYADGGLVGTKTAAPYTFSWNTDPLAEAAHTLQAKAYDAANNVGTSAPVSVTVKHDVTPPTVSITAPAAGAALAGIVTVSANASDDKGVARVEFYKGATLIGTDATAPYSVQWNTSAEAPGGYTITAKAYDTGGNSTTSAGVNVTVKDGVAPTVSITGPANNSTVAKKTTVTISAAASDNVGVTKVEFYVSGVLTCTDTTAPFTCAWSVPSSPGKVYTLTAKGYDAAGNVGASASVTVTGK